MNQFIDRAVRLAYFYFMIVIVVVLPALSVKGCFESSKSSEFRQKMTMATEHTDYNGDKTNGLLIIRCLQFYIQMNGALDQNKVKQKEEKNSKWKFKEKIEVHHCRCGERQTRRSTKKQINTSFSSVQLLYYFQVD